MKKIIAISLISLGVGWGIARHTTPVKTVTVEKELVTRDTDVVTVIKEVVRKDGTKETVTRIEDKSKETTDKSVVSKVDNYKPQYKIDLFAGTDKEYMLSAQRRIFSNVFAGVWANTQGTVGVSIGMEF